MTVDIPDSAYLLPRTDAEARRLQLQSDLLREATEILLAQFSLPASAVCLDVGCGTADALVSISEKVGSGGRFVGLDLNKEAAQPRIEALQALGCGEFTFVQDGVYSDKPMPDGPYDLVFSRYLLHHLEDPAAALSWMWGHVKPGGVLAVMDIDSRGTTTYPLWQPYLELEELIHQVFLKTGVDNYIGHKLPHYFDESAAGKADGVEAIGLVRTIAELSEFLNLLVPMIGEKAIDVGCATEASLAALRDAMATATTKTDIHCWRPAAVGVWKHKRA